jgi:ABC-2 type transport system permease protein
MLGGRVLWLIDAMDADMDSLAVNPQAVSTRLPIGMDEMFYSYGVRINTDLVMDIRCRPIPMVVGQVGDRPQYNFTPWFYFPDLIPMSSHPIVRNLDIIKSDFVSSIQLLDNADNIEKTVLLSTSEYSRVKNAPVIIDLNETRQEPDQRLYNRKNLPVAVLLEGTFRSMWVHRLPAGFTKLPEIGYRDTSLPTKMIVVSDGDIIKNRYNRNDGTTYPLGFDSYTNTMYANKEFLLNAINYLAGNDDAMASRGKSVQLRKLDVVKSKKSEAAVKAVNIVVPVLVALAGVVIYFVRRGKYIKKKS